jgi:CubicO group peptidase (beta-lactamase class C family)
MNPEKCENRVTTKWRSLFDQFLSSKPGLSLTILLILCVFLGAPSKALPQQTAQFAATDLEHFVPEQIKKWKVPGLAIAVLQNGQIVYSRGFGLRDVKRNLPVTTKTLFAIGSISKSFTALSMGILNDQGKLDWDTPVRDYLPDFAMYDPVASHRMTPRDLITHRVGMAGHDVVWYSSDFSREDLVHRLRFLQSNHDFRSRYHYNNLLVTTAGYLVGKISGQSWEEFVSQHVFEPLEMESSNFSVLESQKSSDFSLPYREDEKSGTVSEIPFHPLSAIGPAGSINSNIEDMARYAMFQLGQGKIGDRQLISKANLALNHTPQVPMPDPSRPQEIGPRSYGMGWVISSYRGHALWWHNGGIDGFYALLALLPDDNFGVVILTNMLGDDPVPEIVSYHIYDHLFGLPPVDWNQRFEDLDKKQKAAEEEEHKEELAKRKAHTQPSHELQEYGGVYENPGYGAFSVQFDGKGLKAALNKLSFPLEHYEYDIFQPPPESTGSIDIGQVRFLTDMDGNISAVSAPLEPDAPEIVFTRVHENAPLEQKRK